MEQRGTCLGAALVGRRLDDNDNLGLAYLQAALDQGGIPSVRYTLNDASGLDAVACAVLDSRASVVGLSLPDGGSAPILVALAELLRMRGYRGHITCGGPFATLAREWLLERYPAIDSVVRYAGERPLVELVRALECGRAPQLIAGVTTRAGDGPPAPVLDTLPMRLTPRRDELPTILGHRAAHMLATRGCAGRCTYCGPAALQHDERREGLLGGLLAAQLDDAGVGGVRRRSVDDVCEEMAQLWHGRGVRYFYFVDEHMLPYDEPGALAFLSAMKSGLEKRRVGALGIGAMLRADRISPAIIRAFAEAGLLRLFLGVEFGDEAEARRFGRKTAPRSALELLRCFEQHGVAVVSNMMLVHPASTVETIRSGIGFLADVPSGVFETTRMMVYHGTSLWRRMREQGRLTGNPFRYGYGFDDPVVDRFAQIFTRLRAEAFWDHSIAYRTHDAHLALVLSKRLRRELDVRDIEVELESIRSSVNELYVRTYQTVLELALAGTGAYEAAATVAAARARSGALSQRLERCADRLTSRLDTPSRLFSPMRAAAAGTLAFLMAGASAGACGGKTTVEGANGSGGQMQDSGVDAALLDSSVDASDESTVIVQCTPDEMAKERKAVADAILAQDPCFSGTVYFGEQAVPTVTMVLPYQPMGVRLCDVPGNQARISDAENAAQQALAGGSFPCLNPGSSEYIEVQGGAGVEAKQIGDLLGSACPDLFMGSPQVAIVLDDTGHVVGVVDPYNDGSTLPADIVQCVMNALSGLTFPCLAGYLVCPEYVIAE